MKKCILLIMLIFWTSSATAAWLNDSSDFFIRTRGESVSSLLKSLGKSYHIPVVISKQVSGTFIGEIKNQTPSGILNMLANRFNFSWYYSGNTLYVVSASEMTSKLITPDHIPIDMLYHSMVTNLNMTSPFNKIELDSSSGMIHVYGVPQFIEDAQAIGIAMEKVIDHKNNEDIIVRVFPLAYANAGDITYKYRTESLVIPGVVKQMQEILGGATSGGNAKLASPADNLPKIVADPRQNAVTIMGKASEMAMYARLIKQLDEPLQPINISVTIIDVDAGKLDSLGVDWSASASVGGGSVSFNNKSINAEGTVSTVIDNSKNFLVRINALESKAKARIISSPSVLTLNNMPAILNRNTTFYTKLEGKNTVKLQQVSTGELLRVTPHLIEVPAVSSAKRKTEQPVILTISLEDGSPADTTQQIDNLPQTQDSQINTQAKLLSGQSLLIGGFIRNEHLTETRKIPLLGDLPLIGGLFRFSSHTKRNMVRLFLIRAHPADV